LNCFLSHFICDFTLLLDLRWVVLRSVNHRGIWGCLVGQDCLSLASRRMSLTTTLLRIVTRFYCCSLKSTLQRSLQSFNHSIRLTFGATRFRWKARSWSSGLNLLGFWMIPSYTWSFRMLSCHRYQRRVDLRSVSRCVHLKTEIKLPRFNLFISVKRLCSCAWRSNLCHDQVLCILGRRALQIVVLATLGFFVLNQPALFILFSLCHSNWLT
jgi:hypothetical protein